MAMPSATEELKIDRSQVDKAKTISIVLMCLAAILPILMIIVVYALLRYRSFQKKRKKFVDDWNVARMNSYRNKITFQKPSVGHVSSISYLDANYLPEKADNIKLKRVSTSLSPDETSVSAAKNQKTLQYFNDAYVEESSFEEVPEIITTGSDSKSQGTLQKMLLIHRASSRANISSQNTNVKNAIVQMLNPQDKFSLEQIKSKHNFGTSLPQESETVYDQTPTNKSFEKKDDDTLLPLSLQHRLSQDTNSVNSRTCDLHQAKPIESNSSETILNPRFYNGSIDWVGSHNLLGTNFLEPNCNGCYGNDKTISSLNNTDVFFQSQKLGPVKPAKNREIHWEFPEIAKSKDPLASELDYFANPVMSDEVNIDTFGDRMTSDSTLKSGTNNFCLLPNKNKNEKCLVGDHSKNPLYNEKLSSETGLRSSCDWRALEYYKTHGDTSWERNVSTDYNDTIDDESPKLHRHPGVLDLNTILESEEGSRNDKSVNNSKDQETSFDERKEFNLEDHFLPPPPPSFCDSRKPDLILPNLYLKSKPPWLSPKYFQTSINPTISSEPSPLQYFKTSNENNQDTSIRADSDCNLFESLPEVKAKNKFLELRTLSRKSRQNSSQLIFNKDSILKEEEELALKYFEDICKELSIDSQNSSENGSVDKQPIENVTSHRPLFQNRSCDFKSLSSAPVARNCTDISDASTIKQCSATVRGLPPNFRMSYEHLLSPDYPYQRRKVISSEINANSKLTENLWSPKSGVATLMATSNSLNGESTNDSLMSDGWIVTHM